MTAEVVVSQTSTRRECDDRLRRKYQSSYQCEQCGEVLQVMYEISWIDPVKYRA